jgi:Transglycosylase SLT domain
MLALRVARPKNRSLPGRLRHLVFLCPPGTISAVSTDPGVPMTVPGFRQKRLYWGIVFLAALVAVSAGGYALYGGGYAYYKHRQLTQQQAVAVELCYTVKLLDVDIANVERLMAASGNSQGPDQVKQYLERRRQLQNNYEQFIAGLKLYDRALTPQEQLILRVTRMFGECETAAPPEYLAEVNSYIRKWQSSPRFARDVMRAQEMGYTRKIAEEFQKQNLPPQFFYLALQESNFEEFASGPPSRMGFAKGMWQFIPDTGRRYGLTIGPLAAFPLADPADDRHHWEKATEAAARYIKEIYSTDAQASGLLVMASYNWGEQRIINTLRGMPANPRERNFWKLLENHRDQVPKEAYDYVLSIVSAAVIGENPRLFGFGFDSPLDFSHEQFVNETVSRRPLPSPAASSGSEETAVALFLSGDYAKAADTLTSPSAGPLSPRAYFYYACSRAALVLTRQLDQSALVGARAALAQAGGAQKFASDLPYISPRILQTLAKAAQ